MPKPLKRIDDATAADIIALTQMALREDIGSEELENGMDCTTLSVVPDDVAATATFVARDAGVIAGMELVALIAKTFGQEISVDIKCQDGEPVDKQQAVAVFSGEARKILMLERTCLNFMCRLSGIASLTAEFVKRITGTKAVILDTRKTTPGWRRIEKYAVACGGGRNHRMGLYDAVMIKDNHLAMYGNHIDDHRLSISSAIEMARQWVADNQDRLPYGKQTVVQIEVDTLDQLKIALPANPDIVLLDNMNAKQLAEAVEFRDQNNPDIQLEASGGVNLQTVEAIARSGVDRISIGALTHSAGNFDIGLDWELE